MTQLASVVRSRKFAGTTAAAACLAAIVSVGVTGAHSAPAVPAGTKTVSGGQLTWGVKQSFRNYMTGPIAHGTITPSNGATKSADNIITFGKGTGGVTPNGDFHVAYTGSAHYYGHGGELDFTISDPYVSLSKAGTGDLYVMYAVGKGAPKRVKIASLTGTPVVSGNIASVKDAGTKLTAEGVEVFSYKGSGFYQAGVDLDKVSATGNIAATPAPTSSAPSTPAPTTSTSTQAPVPTTSTSTSTQAPVPTSTQAPVPTTKPTTPATTDPGTPTGPVVDTDLV